MGKGGVVGMEKGKAWNKEKQSEKGVGGGIFEVFYERGNSKDPLCL